MKKNNKKGFTLAELLIVVAIIAVLVAVAIPVFTTQLEKSREGVDLANLRSAYGEAVADALASTDGEGASSTYKMQQQDISSFGLGITTLPQELQGATGIGDWQKNAKDTEYAVTASINESDGSLAITVGAPSSSGSGSGSGSGTTTGG